MEGTNEREHAFGQLPGELGIGEGRLGEPVRCGQLVGQVLQFAGID
ncbi:hypothetical protein ACGFYV_25850 [Streptomyces sp. NPDC048297]